MSFRVESFEDIKIIKNKLESASVEILPLVSWECIFLFILMIQKEMALKFFGTPLGTLPQPQTVVWDTNLNEKEALAWVEETFKDKPNFTKLEDYKGEFVNRNS